MTDHAPDCLTNLKIITPGGEEDRLRKLICTCAAKERARIAELEQALKRAEAELSQLKERVGELPGVGDGEVAINGKWWELDGVGGVCLREDNTIDVATEPTCSASGVPFLVAALLAAAREAGKTK